MLTAIQSTLDDYKKLNNGGRYKNLQGYIVIDINKKRFYEHRLVWERHYKACLLPWSNIHHLNDVKHDNRIENLNAMMIGHHSSLHGYAKDIIDNRRCSICNNRTYLRKSGKQEWYKSPYDKTKWVCRKHYRQYRWKVRKRT